MACLKKAVEVLIKCERQEVAVSFLLIFVMKEFIKMEKCLLNIG